MVDANLLNWSLNHLLALIIIMARVGPLIFLMPVTGSKSVPVQVKVLITVMTALVLVPAVKVPVGSLPSSAPGLAIFVTGEIGFGAVLAVFARFIFAAVETAGQMVSIQMGMGMAGAIDPQFGTQVSLVGELWNLIAILLFLSVNGHHIFFKTMVESFSWMAPGDLHLSRATFTGIMNGAAHMFVLAVKVMAPAGAALIFAHVAMGIIAKTVPQIPILIVGLPLNIAIGFIFISLSLGYFLPLMINNFDMLGRLLPKLAAGMGG